MAHFVHAGFAPFLGDVEEEVAVAFEVAAVVETCVAAEASPVAQAGIEVEAGDLADGAIAVCPVQRVVAEVEGLVEQAINLSDDPLHWAEGRR